MRTSGCASRSSKSAAEAAALKPLAGPKVGKRQRAALEATDGGGELLERLEARRKEAVSARRRAKEPTLHAYRRRLWNDGQTYLRLHKEVRIARMTPRELPVLCEAHAVAFGMGRVGGREARE